MIITWLYHVFLQRHQLMRNIKFYALRCMTTSRPSMALDLVGSQRGRERVTSAVCRTEHGLGKKETKLDNSSEKQRETLLTNRAFAIYQGIFTCTCANSQELPEPKEGIITIRGGCSEEGVCQEFARITVRRGRRCSQP